MTLSGVETVQERPLLSRKSKARLSDCGVVHKVCIDHRGRLPGFSPLTVDVNWFQLMPQRLVNKTKVLLTLVHAVDLFLPCCSSPSKCSKLLLLSYALVAITCLSLKVSISSYRHRSDLVRCGSGSGETIVVEEESVC